MRVSGCEVLIVDDHPLMRRGLACVLEAEGHRVVGEVPGGEEALSLLESLSPDLMTVDLSLPGIGGIELIRRARSLRPDLRSLVVSRHDEDLYAERVLRAGARGFVSKLEVPEVLSVAVRRVLDGRIYLSDRASARLLSRIAEVGAERLDRSPLAALSDRELEVFELVGAGRTTREIAERLHLSVKTVESYKTRIKNKLTLKSASELIRFAVQWVEAD